MVCDTTKISGHFVSGLGSMATLTGPTYLTIPGQVSICMTDGSIKFEPGYTTEAAARQFWAAMSADYRKMLRWKAEHPEAQ